MYIQAKCRKDRMKTEGAYSIWKKGWQADGQTDGRTPVDVRVQNFDGQDNVGCKAYKRDLWGAP